MAQLSPFWKTSMITTTTAAFIFYFHLLGMVANSQTTINTLPGFAGPLPFNLETGYVGVGEEDEVQLFYYFTESEKDPLVDPLLLFLTGGPGCSSLTALAYEIGPISFEFPTMDGDLPSLIQNPYSWTKIANIIFLDTPVGAGFSYAITPEGYHSSDTKTAAQAYDFLRKWLFDHPKFSKNPLYIAGDSYGGMFVPMVVLEISKGKEAGYAPEMDLQGYLLGNPITDIHEESNSRIPYAHQMALISDQYYESVKSSCDGEYVNPDPNNAPCNKSLQLIIKVTAGLNEVHILDKCVKKPKSNVIKWGQRFLEDMSTNIFRPLQLGEGRCWNKIHDLSEAWTNDPSVRQALDIRDGTKIEWKRCNWSLSYENDVQSVVEYHRMLSMKNYRAIVYSGDHDMMAPYISTLSWINSLNMTKEDDWRPWFVDGQVAGFTEEYKKGGYSLTFATVKGAGHIAIEYKPMQCFAMVERWLSKSQL